MTYLVLRVNRLRAFFAKSLNAFIEFTRSGIAVEASDMFLHLLRAFCDSSPKYFRGNSKRACSRFIKEHVGQHPISIQADLFDP